MDMVSIGYAALFGAIGAGCGALAGQLLARVFKFKSNITAGIGAAIGIGLVRLLDMTPNASHTLRAEIEEAFLEEPLFAKLREAFPAEHEAFMAAIERNASSITEADAYQKGFEYTSNLRKKYAPSIRGASDKTIKSALIAKRDTIVTLEEKFGVAGCARFIAEGLFDAIIEGQNSSLNIDPASEADGEAFGSFWAQNGGSSEAFQALQNPSPKDTQVCDYTLSFYNAIINMGGDIGHRIRADSLYSSAVAD